MNTIKSKLICISKFVKGCGGINTFFLIPSAVLKNPSPALTVRFPDKCFVNRSPSKLAPNVPSNILKNPPFCSLVSFLIVFCHTFQ